MAIVDCEVVRLDSACYNIIEINNKRSSDLLLLSLYNIIIHAQQILTRKNTYFSSEK